LVGAARPFGLLVTRLTYGFP